MTKDKISLKVRDPSNTSLVWKAVSTSLVIAAFLCNIGAVVFGYLNATNYGGLFNHTIGYLSDKYYNEVAPLGIIFSIIWPIIYFWTFAGNFYMVISLCFPSAQSPVKTLPALAPNSYFLFICFGFASAVMWLFAFDAENLTYSFTCLATGLLSFMFASWISIERVELNPDKLDNSMLWVMRVLVHNGLGMITTWLTLATSIGLCVVMLYKDSPGQATAILRGVFTVDDASAIVLGVVGGLMVIWFLLQNFAWQKHLAYVYTDYPVLIMAFAGIVAKLSPNPVDRSLIVASINLGLAVLLLLARIGLSVYHFIEDDYVMMTYDDSDKARLVEKEK